MKQQEINYNPAKSEKQELEFKVMERAVIYARVSTERQDAPDRVSIEEQLLSMQNLCGFHNWDVIETLVDNKRYKKTKHPDRGKIVEPSGKYDDRPGFLEMLKLIESGQVDIVVYYDLYRFGRHHRVLGTFLTALEQGIKARGGTPIQVWESAHKKSVSKIELGIMVTIGQEENETRARRMRMGKIGTLKRGLWPGPYERLGYTTEKADRGKQILMGPEEEAQTVKDIFNWYDSGMSIAEIRKRLLAEERAQRGQVCKGKRHQWASAVIRYILRSEDYTGKATWEFNDGTPDMSIEIPRIISNEQFKRVQKRLDAGRQNSKRNTQEVYLLQRLVYCGSCGCAMNISPTKRYYYQHGNKYPYKTKQSHYYQCSDAARYSNEPHSRPWTFTGTKLDEQVWQYLADNVVQHPELIIEQVRNRQAKLKAQGDNLDGDIAKKRKQLDGIEHEKLEYTRQLGRGKITQDMFDILITECNEKENDLREQLDDLLTMRDDAQKVQSGIAHIERLLKNIEKRLPDINQTPEELAALPEDKQREIMLERQGFIRTLCDKIIIHPEGRIEIEGLIDVIPVEIGIPQTDYHKILYTLWLELESV